MALYKFSYYHRHRNLILPLAHLLPTIISLSLPLAGVVELEEDVAVVLVNVVVVVVVVVVVLCESEAMYTAQCKLFLHLSV